MSSTQPACFHLTMQVSGTNIPHFFQVQSLVAGMRADVVAVINAISLKLAAYIQRKAEVQGALVCARIFVDLLSTNHTGQEILNKF